MTITPARLPPPRPRVPLLRKDHPCSAAFLDETGAIAKDPVFAVGLLKMPTPSRMLRAVQTVRDRRHWYKEIKFTSTTRDSLPIYREIVDEAAAASPDFEFFCFVADRDVADPIERFGSQWDAYGKLAEQLVVAALHPHELTSVLADNYSTPHHVLFEEDLKAAVNRRLRRLAVLTVCRMDSRATDGLQMVDMFVSAVAHEFRASKGLASTSGPKADLAAHVRASLGVTGSCLKGWRHASHSIKIYNHGAAGLTASGPAT